MSANIDTILILGATSGIGEQFARHFHSVGKTVIAAGRRVERLEGLKAELPGLETLQIDIEDLDTLESKLNGLIKAFPTLDSVFIVSGKMEFGDFKNPSTTSNASIISEVTTNVIAPFIIARAVVPHLLSLKRPTTFITVSSGLAFIPLPFYPVYNGTKAAIHNFTVTLRIQLAGTNVNVLELAPPYVDTDLDAHYREHTIAAQGGPEKATPPMPLKEYMASAIAGLEKGDQKEITVGFSALGANAWRGAFDPIFEQFGLQG